MSITIAVEKIAILSLNPTRSFATAINSADHGKIGSASDVVVAYIA